MSDCIEWDGGECPLPASTLTRVRLRDGDIDEARPACMWSWLHNGGPNDIVAYQVVEQQAASASLVTKPTNPKDVVGVRKAPMSTLPANVVAEIGVAMLEGATKYGRHNYRVSGVLSSVYYDATLRHLFAWWEGEDIDPDSGLSHVTKALASLVVLRDAMVREKLTDDRPPRTSGFYAQLNQATCEILDRNAGYNPTHYAAQDDKHD